MTWFANSPLISVLLATGIAWIAPQFLIAIASYSIIMALFVIIVRAFAISYFWTGEVAMLSMALCEGYLSIIICAIIRGFVYHIMHRAQKIAGVLEEDKEHPHRHDGYMHYLKMMTSMHGFLIPGFNRFFYNTYAVVVGLAWGALVVGVSWYFFYYEFMVGVWAWVFLFLGVSFVGALLILGIEYMWTERDVHRKEKSWVVSRARVLVLLTIVLQFPIATGIYMMFYMIFHPMAWFGDNEVVVVLMAIAGYIVVNVALVWGVWAWFSSSTGHRGRGHEEEEVEFLEHHNVTEQVMQGPDGQMYSVKAEF